MATIRVPVIVDVDIITPYPKVDEDFPVLTPPSNLPFAVLRGDASEVLGAANRGLANHSYFDAPITKDDKPLQEALEKAGANKPPFMKLSEVLESEFHVTIGSSIVRGGDPSTNAITRRMTFKNMLVKFVNALPEYPVALNALCIVEIVLFDKRDRWGLLSNFNDEINRTKGVSTNGNVAYYNESCFNPLAPQSQRRFWSAAQLFAYCVHLIDGVPMGGTRGTGFEFVDEHVQKRAALNLKLGSKGETVDDLQVYGGNPAQVLEQFLARWGCTLIFPHTGEWYVDRTDRDDIFPHQDIYRYSSEIAPHNFNPISLRAKTLVVYGPDAEYQEGFDDMVEFVDFDYVVPYDGQWVRLDYAWHQCKVSKSDAVDLVSFNEDERYLSPDDYARLAMLASVPTGDDYEAYVFEAAETGLVSVEVARLITSVAENGFRCIRLRRSGKYGELRKPLGHLISVDSLGDTNEPVVVADSWASADVRGSVRVPFSGWDQLTGIGPERWFYDDDVADNLLTKNAVANVNKQVKLNNMPQGMALRDPEALVFSFGQKLIYPNGDRPQDERSNFTVENGKFGPKYTPEPEPEDAGLTVEDILATNPEREAESRRRREQLDKSAEERAQEDAEGRLDEVKDLEPAEIIDALDVYARNTGQNRERAEALIQIYTDKTWTHATSIDFLLASYVPVGLGKGEGEVISKSAYQKTFTSEVGYDGIAYRHFDFLRARFVVAKLDIGLIDYQVKADGSGDTVGGVQAYTIRSTASSAATGEPEFEPNPFLRIQSLDSETALTSGGPVGELRASSASNFRDYFRQLDKHAERFSADYYNRLRHKLGVDYTLVGVRVPDGGGVEDAENDGDGGFIYSASMSTVLWHVDSEGAYTVARYNNPESFSPFVTNYEKQYVDFLNQQRQFNDVSALSEFAKQVKRMSAGRHTE
jgi:hypothetical protein